MVPNSVHLAGVVEQTNLLRDRRVVGGCAKSMMRMASLPCHNPATLSWDFRHCQMTIISCNFHALEAHLFLHCAYQSTSTSGKKTLVAINSVSGNIRHYSSKQSSKAPGSGKRCGEGYDGCWRMCELSRYATCRRGR